MNLDVIQSFLYASVFILGLLVEKNQAGHSHPNSEKQSYNRHQHN